MIRKVYRCHGIVRDIQTLGDSVRVEANDGSVERTELLLRDDPAGRAVDRQKKYPRQNFQPKGNIVVRGTTGRGDDSRPPTQPLVQADSLATLRLVAFLSKNQFRQTLLSFH